jgi:dienelactone hydrolase
MVDDILFETRQVEDIPITACFPAVDAPCPVVFYVPGYSGTKKDGLSINFQLAQQGIACIAFDPLYHGARYDVRLERPPDGVYLPEMGLDIFIQFLQVIRQSALDIQELMTYLSQDSRLNVMRAGVTGISMGLCQLSGLCRNPDSQVRCSDDGRSHFYAALAGCIGRVRVEQCRLGSGIETCGGGNTAAYRVCAAF